MITALLALSLLISGDKPPIAGTVSGGTITVGVSTPGTGATPSAAAPTGAAGPAPYPRTSLVAACTSNGCLADLDCIDGTPYFIYTQASATSAPVSTGQHVCLHSTTTSAVDAIPAATVTAATTAWQQIALPTAVVLPQPGGESVVGVPTLFRAQGPAPTDWSFTLDGIPLHVHATVSWTWDFGDGSAVLTTSTPGRPYSAAQPPDDPRWSATYVQHAYLDATRRHVTVTMHWDHVTLTRTDSGASVALPGRGTTGTARDVTVVELRSELATG